MRLSMPIDLFMGVVRNFTGQTSGLGASTLGVDQDPRGGIRPLPRICRSSHVAEMLRQRFIRTRRWGHPPRVRDRRDCWMHTSQAEPEGFRTHWKNNRRSSASSWGFIWKC